MNDVVGLIENDAAGIDAWLNEGGAGDDVAVPVDGNAATVASIAALAADVLDAPGTDLALVSGEQDAIEAPVGYAFPVALFKAAMQCTAPESDDRAILRCVYMQADDEVLRLIGSDGRRMMVCTRPVVGMVPAWLKAGVLIPTADRLAAKLNLIAALWSDEQTDPLMQIDYADGAPHACIRDLDETMSFRFAPQAGPYFDYDGILGSVAQCMTDRTFGDMEGALYNPTVLRSACDVSKTIGGGAVALFTSGGRTIVTFEQAPGCALVLMGLEGKASLGEHTLRALGSATKLSLGAYKANITRNEALLDQTTDEDARTAIEAKIADIKARMEAAIAAAAAPQIEAPAEAPATTTKPATKAKGKAKKPAKAAV